MRRRLAPDCGRRGNVDLLAAGLAPARGARQAEERGGGFRIAGEGGLEGPVFAGLGHADEIPEAAIGIDGRAVEACDEHAVLEAVGERLDEIVVAHALADPDVAGEVAEDEEGAEHGEGREQREQQRLGGAAGDEREHDRSRERGDQKERNGPVLAGTGREHVISRKCGLRLAYFAFAHEGESYLILGEGRVGRLHGILCTLRYNTHVRSAAGGLAALRLAVWPR